MKGPTTAHQLALAARLVEVARFMALEGGPPSVVEQVEAQVRFIRAEANREEEQ